MSSRTTRRSRPDRSSSEPGATATDLDALIHSAPVGVGQIDASGTVSALNGRFAALLDVSGEHDGSVDVAQLPSELADLWREVIGTSERAELRRWTVGIGAPHDRRPVDVIAWRTGASRDGVVHMLILESQATRAQQTLSGVVERARLAREIHDGLAQELWLAKLTASNLARNPNLDRDAQALCAELQRSIEKGLVEARNAVVAMRSDPADTITLSELVERQTEEFADRFGVRIDCHAQVVEPLPPRVAVEILRVLQEALNNVRKHASARRIVVRLGYRRRFITLSVRDDGQGFDASARPGYGRQSMEERAQSIGGRLTISSAPGQGTTVTLRVPPVEVTAR